MTALIGWTVAAAALAGWMRCVLRARIRTELIARACHEVRGPLTAASLALHALTRSGAGDPPSTAGVQRELARAAVALQDVVAAGRGRRQPDRPESVDVREVLAVQAATWRPVARSFGTDLRVRGVDLDATVRVDRVRLVQATANLIANALEHGGGPVTLGATSHPGHVRIEVADEGTGPATVAFGEAARQPGTSRGRGLAIVADIAARHGGRLVAGPAGPGGTRMVVELPRAKEPA